MIRTVFIILILFIHCNALLSQFFDNGNNNSQISVSFYSSKVDATSNSSIFNILTIKNNTNKKFIGKLEFTKPTGWAIIGESEEKLNIPAYESIDIPLRILVAKDAMGEVGYAVIANLFDNKGVQIISENCFVTVPRLSDIRVQAPRRMIYFDNKTETAEFNYYIENKGNVDENVQIAILANENLSIEQHKLDKLFAYECNIPAHSDTTVNVKISLDNHTKEIESYKTDVMVYTQDSLYKNNLWLFKIDNTYDHHIPEENKCAILELTASDIFSQHNTKYSVLAKGSILFKNELDFSYFLYKHDINKTEYDYYDTRFYLELRNNYFKLRGGTMESLFNEYIYGLGALAEVYTLDKRLTLGGFYSYNNESTQTAYGTQFAYKISKKVLLMLGYANNSIEQYKNYSNILMSGVNFSFLKNNQLSFISYFNKTEHAIDKPFSKYGLGFISRYSGNFNKFRANARVEYGSPQYSGRSRGKLIANANLNYQLAATHALSFTYMKNDMINSYYINDVYQPERKTFFDSYKLSYTKKLTKNLSIQTGPLVRLEKINTPYIDTLLYFYFKTYSPRWHVAAIYNKYREKIYIRPSGDIGHIFVSNALENNDKNKSFLTYNIGLNTLYKDFNLYLTFRNGPYSIYQQYYYYSSDNFTKWLFLMPSYNLSLFDNTINFNFRAAYHLDLNLKNNSINFTSQASILLAETWSLRLMHSFNSYSKRNVINNATSRYNSTYLELTLRKEFNCKQPRFQYHNLKVYFFKDLNGDREKQESEPGLRNVLAAIEPNYKLEADNIHKDFVSTQFLTSPDGKIEYDNIVNGEYIMKYTLIGDMVGNFNREEQVHKFSINEDKTIFIPYLENNRIIGKIELRRSPLSSLGSIDVSNIRVIAEDTKGHTYSTLTDDDGTFTIYAPVTDHYTVRINNIFRENFDLEKDEFIVKFNGYKQFNVTFVFKEKRRKINFSDTDVASPQDNQANIKALRKTILSGKIEDAIGAKPIGAEVKIINNANGHVIATAKSNEITGYYTITYVTGENYRIEVTAPGYMPSSENLYIDQVIEIQNITMNIPLMKKQQD